MNVFACGYNGQNQLHFTCKGQNQNSKHGHDNDVGDQDFNVKSSKNVKFKQLMTVNSKEKYTRYKRRFHPDPVRIFSLHKDFDFDEFKIHFTWSNCVASIKSDNTSAVFVSGIDKDGKDNQVPVLENVLCLAVLEDSILLKDLHDPHQTRILNPIDSSQCMHPLVVKSDKNQTVCVKLNHIEGGHKDYYLVYDGVCFGKYRSTDCVNSSELKADKKDTTCQQNVTLYSGIIQHIDAVTPIKEISCGKEHVLLLSNTGSIYSYGLSSRGQLGHGDIEKESSPRLIDALDGVFMKSVKAGGWHSTAVSEFGDLYVWGWNESGQLGLATTKDREELNEETGIVTLPVCVDVPEGKDTDEVAENIKEVTCGSRHTVVLTDSGSIFTCGWNQYGQLGLGDTVNRRMLTKVKGLTGCRVFAGHWNSAFLCKEEVF